jgi:hypothetical protein
MTVTSKKSTTTASTTSAESTATAVSANDVLLGRGGATNQHEGNRKFRELVAAHQAEYLKARKQDKIGIARRIVSIIVKERGGRFLQHDRIHDTYTVVTDKRATEKTSQALREGLDVRNKTFRPEKQIKSLRNHHHHHHHQQQQQQTLAIPKEQPPLWDAESALSAASHLPTYSPSAVVEHPVMTAATSTSSTLHNPNANTVPHPQHHSLLIPQLTITDPAAERVILRGEKAGNIYLLYKPFRFTSPPSSLPNHATSTI